ncbi:cell division protein SepF [Propioniciclava coleopterorum]|uniref:Cell division protein SepF n=2 Tax=Propioniciclava coleopterorum TaxID=2714937 RepID=A0A6G7YAW4_9ACTN|nr:cell division protein SepF [Propioniciclava coleopterorum]QIK73962.1 cell division protein SepF [Propioniciclava coleopterorum]
MADGLKKAAVWLGLMSDTPYPDDERDDELTEAVPARDGRDGRDSYEREERGAIERVEHTDASITPLEGRRPAAVPRTADLTRIVTVHPRTYNEARTIGEHFRDGIPVIMNLSDMEDADAKRLVDFAAGLIFGLRGAIERVTSKVFLLSPADVVVTAEDKERIAGGFFNQS